MTLLSVFSRCPRFSLFATLLATVHAQPLYIPNASFEAPPTEFVDTRVDSWRKTPRPAWYEETGEFSWDQLSGVFRNTPPGSSDHIGNADGAQALFLFAVPEVGISQELPGETFTIGKKYTLTAGIIGGGGNMTNGVSLEMRLYYLNTNDSPVVVGSTNIVYDPDRFPSITNLVDVELSVGSVAPDDPWAGRPIGIAFFSTVDPSLAGGYWDLDHVRLTASIHIPNGSFETPFTEFADPRIDYWQKTPKPDWYDETSGSWDQLTGVFRNTAPGQDDHLENADGAQALFLFAVPEVGIFLDEHSTNAPIASEPPLRANFEVGSAYTLVAAVQGGGGGMTNGVTLELGLYYRDDQGAQVPVATTIVTNEPGAFPSPNHLVDYEVRTAPVRATDPWAGRSIGIRLLSTVQPTLAGGYWDIDHIRLLATPALQLSNPQRTENGLRFIVQGEPGAILEVLETRDVTSPGSAWTSMAMLTNTTGVIEFTAPVAASAQHFYRVRQVP